MIGYLIINTGEHKGLEIFSDPSNGVQHRLHKTPLKDLEVREMYYIQNHHLFLEKNYSTPLYAFPNYKVFMVDFLPTHDCKKWFGMNKSNNFKVLEDVTNTFGGDIITEFENLEFCDGVFTYDVIKHLEGSSKMTPEQLKEVNAKVEFQMNELLTGIGNRVNGNWEIAFQQGSQKHSHYWEAWKELQKMFKKEQMMIEPIQILSDDEWLTKRDTAVEKLSHRLLKRGSREYFYDREAIVYIVEELLR